MPKKFYFLHLCFTFSRLESPTIPIPLYSQKALQKPGKEKKEKKRKTNKQTKKAPKSICHYEKNPHKTQKSFIKFLFISFSFILLFMEK